jgi:cell fate regulator YaaT (PSP1 superfamily)
MRMAKLQKSTLDPAKISGRCGRLKCCLRFEQDVYEEFQKELPPPGARILTAKGQGRVLAQEILARRLLVEFEDGRRVIVTKDEILTRL